MSERKTSLNEEQYYSLKETYKLLFELIDPQKTPRIPKEIRDKARKCIQHYPIDKSIQDLVLAVNFWNPR